MTGELSTAASISTRKSSMNRPGCGSTISPSKRPLIGTVAATARTLTWAWSVMDIFPPPSAPRRYLAVVADTRSLQSRAQYGILSTRKGGRAGCCGRPTGEIETDDQLCLADEVVGLAPTYAVNP